MSDPLPPDRTGAAVLRRALSEAVLPLLPTLAYALRTMLAIGLALFTAFFLQLQSPLSSVTTVLIVANPVTGALVSKSLWRLFGTLLGAAAAVMLMAVFAQSPVLFTVALSTCIGIACVVSSLLRYFKAYGAVLAGYTIIIVCAGSFSDPQNIFVGALSRVSSVSVGLLSAALVFLLTTQPMPSRFDRAVRVLVRDVARAFVLYRAPPAGWTATVPRAELIRRVNALDEQIEYAAADSYALRRRSPRLRRGSARLLGLLAVLEPLHDRLARDDPAVQDARGLAHRTMSMLSELSSEAPPDPLAAVLPAIRTALAEVKALRSGLSDPEALTVLMHEEDLLEQLAHAVADLSGNRVRGQVPTLPPFLDWHTAFRNGLRGMLVTLLGGLFWYVTRWTAGPTLLSFLVPAACLLSSNPSASQASVNFAIGTLLAVPASMLYQIMVLPQVDGFPLLWGSICLFLLPGIWLQFDRRNGLRAFGYVVFFDAMVDIHNPITFDDIFLFNTWLAFVLGSAMLVLVFRVLLPADPARDVVRLERSICRALVRLVRRRRPPPWEAWQYRQMQKVLRLIQRMEQIPGGDPVPTVQAAFALVALGRVVLWLEEALKDLPPEEQRLVRGALRALRELPAAPAWVAQLFHGAAARQREVLEAIADDSGKTPRARLVIGALGEAALLIDKAEPMLGNGRRFPDTAVRAGLSPC